MKFSEKSKGGAQLLHSTTHVFMIRITTVHHFLAVVEELRFFASRQTVLDLVPYDRLEVEQRLASQHAPASRQQA